MVGVVVEGLDRDDEVVVGGQERSALRQPVRRVAPPHREGEGRVQPQRLCPTPTQLSF